jgi:hypothetical protein
MTGLNLVLRMRRERVVPGIHKDFLTQLLAQSRRNTSPTFSPLPGVQGVR